MRRLARLPAIVILCGCAADLAVGISDDVERAILQRTVHELDWQDYDGTGDPKTAVYTLDKQPIGKGHAGIEELRRIIAKMPKGSHVNVGPYYVNERGGQQIKYPFDTFELYKYCEQFGVILGVPQAG